MYVKRDGTGTAGAGRVCRGTGSVEHKPHRGLLQHPGKAFPKGQADSSDGCRKREACVRSAPGRRVPCEAPAGGLRGRKLSQGCHSAPAQLPGNGPVVYGFMPRPRMEPPARPRRSGPRLVHGRRERRLRFIILSSFGIGTPAATRLAGASLIFSHCPKRITMAQMADRRAGGQGLAVASRRQFGKSVHG